MDKADGSGTILFDLAARDWSPAILEALRIDPAWLPPTFEGPEVTGAVSPAAAAATGSGGDAGRGRRRRPSGERRRDGSGRCRRGDALARHVWRDVPCAAREPLIEPGGRVHAFCHAVPGRWHMMSVMLSAAGSLRWFRDALAPGVEFEALVDEAAGVPAGAEACSSSYLTGERSPHPDPLAGVRSSA